MTRPLTAEELDQVRQRNNWVIGVTRSPFEQWAGQPEIDRARLLATLDATRATPVDGLRELADIIRAEQARLPVATVQPGEVLATLPDGQLLTEAQRGSLRGQGAALGWVLNQIAALATDNHRSAE